MSDNGKEKLSASRLSCLRRCPRQHWLRYEVGLKRNTDESYMRIGTAHHLGQEAKNNGKSDEAALAIATAGYAEKPPWAEQYDWDIEYQTVLNLLAGHFWRYANDPIEIVAAEQEFKMPLVNPDGGTSRTFVLAGKIDGIGKLTTGEHVILEYKTCGDDIGPNSDYWQRLRLDAQVSQYVLGAQHLGYEIHTILYDVTRKPTIKPRQVPVLDEDGKKIVLDAEGSRVMNKDGKTPRQSADAKQGYILKTKPEAPEDFGARLLQDIGSVDDDGNPKHEFYYARRQIVRLADQIEEFRRELWQQAKELMDRRRYGRWFRDVRRDTCSFCDYRDLCLTEAKIDPEGQAPQGFRFSRDVNPELSGVA